MKFKDIETGEILTIEQLIEEFQELKEYGHTEAETAEDYLKNCIEGGTLARIRE